MGTGAASDGLYSVAVADCIDVAKRDVVGHGELVANELLKDDADRPPHLRKVVVTQVVAVE